MERRIGEQFMYGCRLLKVVESPFCIDCVFFETHIPCKYFRRITGECVPEFRSDRKNVEFVEVDPNNP